MKRIRFALTTMGLLMGLFMATPAYAVWPCGEGTVDEQGDVITSQVHQGDCTIGSINSGGDVLIQATGTITISGSTTAAGEVSLDSWDGAIETGSITANGGAILLFAFGDITTSSLSSALDTTLSPFGSATINGTVAFGYGLYIDAPGNIHVTGAISGTEASPDQQVVMTASDSGATITLDSNLTAPGYAVSLTANSSISTKSINTSTSDSVQEIRIRANTGGGTTERFMLGAGGANGVNGTLNAHRSTGATAVAIENGGTGGIEVSGSAIDVRVDNAKSGSIFLKAPDALVKVSGTLSASGTGNNDAGFIVIVSDKIETTNTQILANSTAGSAHPHYITVATSEIKFTGGLCSTTIVLAG